MPKHLMLGAACVCAFAHAIRTKIKARKAAELYLQAVKLYEETEAANHAQIDYLVSLLKKHDITPTEFDLIALNYHTE